MPWGFPSALQLLGSWQGALGCCRVGRILHGLCPVPSGHHTTVVYP